MLRNIQTPIMSRWEWVGIQLVAFVQLAESTMFGRKGCKVATTAEAASTKTKGNEPPAAMWEGRYTSDLRHPVQTSKANKRILPGLRIVYALQVL